MLFVLIHSLSLPWFQSCVVGHSPSSTLVLSVPFSLLPLLSRTCVVDHSLSIDSGWAEQRRDKERDGMLRAKLGRPGARSQGSETLLPRRHMAGRPNP